MRRPIVAGNWKMYKDVNEAIDFVNEIKRALYDIEDVEIVVCPPFTNLADVRELTIESNILLGAQNCFWEKEGAYTGEVSCSMIKSVGCKYVIIGHSERRKYFGETDESVNKKIAAAITNGLVPIVCVGETLEEREIGKTISVVKTQVTKALDGFNETYLDSLVIAYEPVWAIGTGKTATSHEAEEVHKMIRELLANLYSKSFSDSRRIIYGGSIKPENIGELVLMEDIDGGLVGGASLQSASFIDIIKNVSRTYSSSAQRTK